MIDWRNAVHYFDTFYFFIIKISLRHKIVINEADNHLVFDTLNNADLSIFLKH